MGAQWRASPGFRLRAVPPNGETVMTKLIEKTAKTSVPAKAATKLARGAPSGKDTVHSRKALADLAKSNVSAAKAAKGAAPKAAPATGKGKAPKAAPAPRTSKFAGKTIRTTLKDNPRREGTHGFKSFQIILKSKGAISYEAYKAAGGRNNDLQWDVNHSYVTVK
jgi:hypothetical protein